MNVAATLASGYGWPQWLVAILEWRRKQDVSLYWKIRAHLLKMPTTTISPSKTLIVVLCCAVPAALVVGISMILNIRNDGERIEQVFLGLAIVCITLLVASRAFESCTVKLDDAGIEQMKFLSGAKFFVKQRLQWSDIANVSVEGNSYRLSRGPVEVTMRLMVFGHPAIAETHMVARLPPGLLPNTAV